jgi:hypothetical protein
MATPYLDLAGFTLRTVMPPGDVQLVEMKAPGYVAARLVIAQSKLDSRLRKRYAIPFATPIPEIVLGWLTALVTPDVYRKRGVDPQDPQIASVEKDRDEAVAEIKEAADSQDGLFDLPLNEAMQTSAITSGGPMGSSQVSPYEWIDIEAEARQ